MAGIIEVKDQGKVRIYDADNSNYIDIVVPSTVSSNRTVTLPDASFTVPNISGITEADMFRLTADLANPGDADITANLERVDDASFAKIGTGMTENSGIFTFSSTGLYYVKFVADSFYNNDYIEVDISVSTDGTNFDLTSISNSGNTTVNGFTSMVCECFINVTNTSNFKVKFSTVSMTAATLRGNTAHNETHFTFIKLGNSQ